MKRIKLSLVALVLTTMASTQAVAGDRDLGQIFRECGIGAMLFPNDSTLAIISNVIWDLGTTASSSNASSEGTCKGKSAKVAAFVATSYDKLEAEIASGKGEYIETLSKITGKSVSEIRASFAKAASDKSFSSLKKQEKAEKLFEVVSL